MSRITNKTEYYRLARRHLLGNTIRQWSRTEFAALRDNAKRHPGDVVVPGVVALRGTTPQSQLYQGYNLTPDEAMERATNAHNLHGIELLVDEQAPDDLSVIKGEVMRTERYLYMRYDETPGLRMREAYPIMKHAEGLEVVQRLRRAMDASSWQCLNQLFDEYPDSIVEFTVYSKALGHFNRNTVFWEVRNY
jgi:hypothetical protein